MTPGPRLRLPFREHFRAIHSPSHWHLLAGHRAVSDRHDRLPLPACRLGAARGFSHGVGGRLPAGREPSTVALSLAAPLERRLGQIAGVNEMTSVSTLGGCSITIQFDLNRNVDGAARDVQAAINAAANELPINLPGPPTYRKINPADAPILTLAMTSDSLPPTTVFEVADEIVAQRLSQVEGVSQVFVSGSEKSAVRVQINPAQLATTGLSLEDIRSLIGKVNVDSPKGSVQDSNTAYAITSNDQIFGAKDYHSLILNHSNGVPIRLSSLGASVTPTLRSSAPARMPPSWLSSQNSRRMDQGDLLLMDVGATLR